LIDQKLGIKPFYSTYNPNKPNKRRRKMKNLRLFILMTLIVSVFAFMGVPPSSAKPLVLKWTTFEPDVPGSTQLALKRMAKLVDEGTEGRVKIKIYWGSVLGKAPDFLKMTGGAGVADGAFLVTTYNQWEVPLLAASGLPFLSKGYRVGPLATWELYNEWPAMQAEMKKVNVKPLWVFQPHPHWAGVKQPITTFDDLKGKKLWVAGFWQELADAIGIVNVPMIAPQAYDALNKGVIVGVMGMPYHTWRIFKYTETLKYLVELPYGGQPMCAQVVNLDKWNKISRKDQKTIEEIMAGMHDWFVVAVDEEAVKLGEFYKKQGVTEIRLSPEEYARVAEIGRDVVWNSWLKTANAKGVPGDEWFTRYRAMVQKYSK
jgi:TRAP-type C4-dicarboxylate transport system substrate-binding protein